MTQNVIETSKDGKHRVRVELDDSPASPRDNDTNLTHAVTVPDSRYIDVGGHRGPLADGWDRVKNGIDAVQIFVRWARIFHDAVVKVHTDHQSPLSVWYILPEQIKETGGTPEETLQAEIDEYRMWAEGEVYGYIIESATRWQNVDDPDDKRVSWEHVDSCWGFIGHDWAHTAARAAFAAHMEGTK